MSSVTVSRQCSAGAVKGAGAEGSGPLHGTLPWEDEIRFVRLSQRNNKNLRRAILGKLTDRRQRRRYGIHARGISLPLREVRRKRIQVVAS